MPLRHKDAYFLSQFPGLQLLRQDGSTVPATEAFKGKKYVLIYFSAHWCPPCQRFTPLLADFYDEHKDACDFEVLFVSSDREEGRMMDFFQNRSSNYVRRSAGVENGDAAAATAPAAASSPASPELAPGAHELMMGCDISSGSKNSSPPSSPVVRSAEAPLLSAESKMRLRNKTGASRASPAAAAAGRGNGPRVPRSTGHGNWLALPFKETDVARFLSRAYSVVSIPKLVVVAVDTSCMVTREGKIMVMKDPDAAKFPWRFAEGSMTTKQEGMRECIALFLLLIVMAYYYFWGF